ncbi:ATP-binding protein [Nitrospinota bacterium]
MDFRLWFIRHRPSGEEESSARNGEEPCVEIGSKQEDGETVYYVRDNGMGVDPRFHERIFGLFNRLDMNSGGSGIGLTLVRRIVEVHGGRIWVESEGPGRGSTFFFTLPPRHER